ncbi:RNA-binding protein [Granulicatella sp. zg-ZJ]|uniref:YlmH family RNA-binding protein n=1 Tax=unclassified Granulicatella TaxID=2630493 RepID=UPI0013C27E6C|nr:MULTISPECIES: YlmH/Sll1252 family protein [unclassified Granulicatella]NEW62936.1 RNA-binding protein [Granulicatella sp. zg-ZJ]NEW66712.1 RNA-binding protein [Granulicatella sp. zg-84]QMI85309.1 RNA-binding protein [Carnobacteriaceae bacterium zg-84]
MKHVYQHFKKDEYTFIEKVNDWKMYVQDTGLAYLTPFLNPREQWIIDKLISKSDDIHYLFFGGFEESEQKRCLLSYDTTFQSDDFEITVCQIEYPKKFATLKHSSILGSLLGLGIKREQIGDIITNGTDWQFIVSSHVVSYILLHLTKIGATKVSVKTIDLKQVIQPTFDFMTLYDTVSSLRLDSIISSAYHLSRQKAKTLIEQGAVKLNWVEEIKSMTEVQEFDTISVRGYGRIRFIATNGISKSGKYRVHLDILKNKK